MINIYSYGVSKRCNPPYFQPNVSRKYLPPNISRKNRLAESQPKKGVSRSLGIKKLAPGSNNSTPKSSNSNT